MHQASTLKSRTTPGAILIYVLLVFAVMGTLLSLMLTTFGANNRFAERAITDTRLRMENQSTIGKVLGLYQSDPRHPQLGPLNTSRRAVTYLPYLAKREGYLALNKAVVINVDGRDYPDRNLIPTSIKIRNMPDSQGALSVIGRTIRTDTNFIESASTIQLSKPTGPSATETDLVLPADLTNGEQRFVRRYEIILFSNTDVLYEAVPNGATQFVGDKVNIAVTSRNASILGVNQITSSNSASYTIRPPSVTLVSPDSLRNGSSGTASLSSWNYPGISTAFIDTFDGLSSGDWTTSWNETTSPHFSGGLLSLNTGDTITTAQPLSGDFDVRVTSNKGTLPNSLLRATIGASTVRKIGIATVNVFGAVGTTCAQTFSGVQSYVTYGGASPPTNVSDGSAVCSATYPDLYVGINSTLPVGQTMSIYTFRYERKGDLINAYVCEGNATNECDRADKFILLNASPDCANGGTFPSCTNGSAADATFTITAATNTASIQSARIARLSASPRTYTKPITFERTVKIKQVELLGYVPPNAGFSITTTPNLCGTSSSPSGTCGNQTRIIPTSYAVTNGLNTTNTLSLNLSFTSTSGDISEIPFIYGIRVSYE